ncbi:MAG: NAD(P)H-dependent oxidoreductase [Rhodobacteraceae bacterium]|jgi:NAD(P)H dehydrogenase (quinone)|nr:NAD(P)H-dependent oxidoreductase [Paracoccaceae bacterium]MBL4557085.1 NAD(P)H-dependent oxidoreductase [Paracoccaceae bacterium]HBG97419.1 flavodoxin family protein [Paracoccaceae bacterium]
MPERIFILNGHPGPSSISRQAMARYAAAAEAAGHEVRLTQLSELAFDADRGKAGYEGAKPLEPVLEEALANLEWCSHFVLAFPLWWGGFPAKLKGWIDRVLLPGRTFTTEETTPIGLPAPLLKGRTARVLITSDTPRSFMWLAYGDAIMRQLRGQILGFVGFKPVRITFFAPASDPKPGAVDKLLARMAQLGRAGR